jgi:hypothetical protein
MPHAPCVTLRQWRGPVQLPWPAPWPGPALACGIVARDGVALLQGDASVLQLGDANIHGSVPAGAPRPRPQTWVTQLAAAVSACGPQQSCTWHAQHQGSGASMPTGSQALFAAHPATRPPTCCMPPCQRRPGRPAGTPPAPGAAGGPPAGLRQTSGHTRQRRTAPHWAQRTRTCTCAVGGSVVGGVVGHQAQSMIALPHIRSPLVRRGAPQGGPASHHSPLVRRGPPQGGPASHSVTESIKAAGGQRCSAAASGCPGRWLGRSMHSCRPAAHLRCASLSGASAMRPSTSQRLSGTTDTRSRPGPAGQAPGSRAGQGSSGGMNECPAA